MRYQGCWFIDSHLQVMQEHTENSSVSHGRVLLRSLYTLFDGQRPKPRAPLPCVETCRNAAQKYSTQFNSIDNRLLHD